MISTVSGSFTGFSVDTASSSDDFSDASIQVSVDVKTIHTKNEQRDGHLVSGDFFDAEKYPAITFTSTKMEKKSNEEYALHGNLTIRDVTQPITPRLSSTASQKTHGAISRPLSVSMARSTGKISD